MERQWSIGEGRTLRSLLAYAAIAAFSLIAAWLPASARADFAFSPPGTLAEPGAAAPDLAADAQGNTTIVWQELTEDGVIRSIRAARLSADGTLGPAQTLTSMTSGPACPCPQVVVDSQGRATVTWIGGVSPSDRNRMQAVQLGADGLPIGPVKTLSAPDERVSEHVLAVDSLGRATVVWGVGGGLGDPPGRIDSVRLLPDGTAEPVQTLSEPGAHSTVPSIATDHGDRAVVAMKSENRLQLIRIGADGSPGLVQTVLPPEAHAGAPKVVIDSENRTTIAYWRVEGFQSKAVRVEADGTVGPILDLSPEGEQTFPPLVAIDSADRVTVVWESFSQYIKTARIAANGTVGPVREVSGSEARPVGRPQIAIGAGDEAVVVWAHSPPGFIEPLPPPECEEDFDPSADFVQAAFISVDGIPGPIHSVSPIGEQSTGAAVAVSPLGRVIVAWHSFDGTYYCQDVDVRLQMSWGPWSEPVIEEPPPPQTPPAPPPREPDPPLPTATLRLGKRAAVRGEAVVARGFCLGAGPSCKSSVKLLDPTKRIVARGRFQLGAGTKRLLRLRLSGHGRDLLKGGDAKAVRATVRGVGVMSSAVSIRPASPPISKSHRRP